MTFYYHLLRILSVPIGFLSKLKKRRKPEKIYFEKVNKLFKDIKKVKAKVFKGVNEFIIYECKSYITRNSNNKLTETLLDESTYRYVLVLGKSMMGKTSMVFNEIIRNRKKLKNWLVFIPEDFESIQKWNRKLPLWIISQKKMLFIDDIDRFAPLGKHGLSAIIDVLSKRGKLKVIATCRPGDEWDSVKSEFADFFDVKIEPEEISVDDADKLAKIDNKDIKDFDGSPGSIILGIKRQRQKIDYLKQSNPDCYNLLKSAAVMHYFLWYRNYEKKLLSEIAEYILDISNFEKNFAENLEYLISNNIVSFQDVKEIRIPDPYLDKIINILVADKEKILNNFDNYIRRKKSNEDIIIRLVFYYTYDLGHTYDNEGNYDRAIECDKKAIDLKSDFYGAWFNMGNVYNKKGELDKAIECYKKALEIKPVFYEALNNMGNVFWRKKEQDKAIQCYKKAIEIKPDDHNAWYNLGLAYIHKKKNEEALECFEKVTIIKKDQHQSWLNMGNIYDLKCEHIKAIECYEKAVEIKSDYFEALNNMGNVYKEKGDHKKVRDCFQRVVRIKPDNHVAWHTLGVALGKLEEYSEAIEALVESSTMCKFV